MLGEQKSKAKELRVSRDSTVAQEKMKRTSYSTFSTVGNNSVQNGTELRQDSFINKYQRKSRTVRGWWHSLVTWSLPSTHEAQEWYRERGETTNQPQTEGGIVLIRGLKKYFLTSLSPTSLCVHARVCLCVCAHAHVSVCVLVCLHTESTTCRHWFSLFPTWAL